MKRITIVISISVLTAISLKWLPFPFVWIFACSSLVSFLLVKYGRKSSAVIWFNVGSILLILTILEITLEIFDPFKIKSPLGIRSNQLYETISDPDLGSVLKPNSRRRVWKSYNDKMLYDVTYTTDKNGLRISPPCSGTCKSSVLFFGGSFMFGEGVNDHETMPYQVGLQSHGQYKIYNYGIHGHGPQLMLALIESGNICSTVNETPDFAIYLALYPRHVYRVAGLRSWVRNGPRYVLDSGGNASRAGRFSDDDLNVPFWPVIRRQIKKSTLGNNIFNYTRPIDSKDDELFVAVVMKSAQLLRQINPGIEFHVLIWGDPPVDVPVEVISRLEGVDIPVHYVDRILRDNNTTDSAARIELDRHPTAFTNKLIADYFVRRILKLNEPWGKGSSINNLPS